MTIAKQAAGNLVKQLSPFDHRTIGAKQKLFFFSEFSQGSCFFLPRGAHIYNKLIDYLRHEYKIRNYQEVITPNVFDTRLWERSGHWEHYKDHMIKFKSGDYDFSLKPMNCPGHCLMYKNQTKGMLTNKDLPIRWADFGVLHRDEFSGALIGLTRLKRFQQDDAHIFCTEEQIKSEVEGCLSFAKKVYEEFDFTFDLKLSLRPKSYMGNDELWDKAENSLREALDVSALNWSEQKFEGAFYGPKIDLIVKDSQERSQQCATIQLDFQLPERFELAYKNLPDRTVHRPVILHRAVFGSIERFMAMIAENYGGRWPFWLSPVQVHIVPVSEQFNEYALQVEKRFNQAGFMADCELDTSLTLNKKVRNAELVKYNFIIVVGNKEAASDSVTVRLTDDKRTHQLFVTVDSLIEQFKEFKENRVKGASRKLLEAIN